MSRESYHLLYLTSPLLPPPFHSTPLRANRLRCRTPYRLAPPLLPPPELCCVRQRHLGHIYQNILRIQKQKFATLPHAPYLMPLATCRTLLPDCLTACLPMRFLSPTSNHCTPPQPPLATPLPTSPQWSMLLQAVSTVCISHLTLLFLSTIRSFYFCSFSYFFLFFFTLLLSS